MADPRSGEIMRCLREQGYTADELALQVRAMLSSENIGDKKWALEYIRKATEHEEEQSPTGKQAPMDIPEAVAKLKAAISSLIDYGILRDEARDIIVPLINAPALPKPLEEKKPDGKKNHTFR